MHLNQRANALVHRFTARACTLALLCGSLLPATAGGPARAPGGARSYLGPGCVFDGQIRGRGSLECHGSLTGDISLDGDIVIGERGRAIAKLTGHHVRIDGRLEGDALGVDKVEVGATGHVQGDIRAPSVAFAEGAFFEGNVEMRSSSSDGDPEGS